MSLEIRAMRDAEMAVLAPQRQPAVQPESPPPGDGDAQLAQQWVSVRARLQAQVGEVEYRTWLKQVGLAGMDGDEVNLILPTRFLRDWVAKEYGTLITNFWKAENPAVRRVDIRTRPARGAVPDLGEPNAAQSGGQSEPRQAPGAANPATPFPPRGDARNDARGDGRGEPRADVAAPLDQRFTFETFIVGKPNEFAYACARRVAAAPATAEFNPLFLYGGVGLGKTHLMHAIAWELSMKHGKPATVAYMSAEKFMFRFINALRFQSTMEFKNELRSVDVLMIDDLQFLIGKDNTQEEFFHTFNALIDSGKQIVISADKSPSDLSVEDRLRTRLGCGMVADLHNTTYELRISILEAKAARAGVPVPPKVLEFLAHKITSNVRELEGALNRLIAHANLFDRALTLETAQEVLHDLLRAYDRRVTIQEIQKKVAEHYNIRVTEMSSARRSRNIARPRQVAMFLSKQLTSKSLPDIGRQFGDRDHTTVMHAVSRITDLMSQDTAFAEDVDLLRRMLES